MKSFERAYVLIKAENNTAASIQKELSTKSGIKFVDVIYGPYDIIAVVEANDRDELSRIVMGNIRSLSGVIETVTCICVNPSTVDT